ncbi:hypothetical protein B0H16DRAFT_1786890 [Mycena metata]|uniref:Uncharacterized protein n=1 Tax=Mycena metata TaxID=1033252 RepID=A0AAD7HMI7_9AGAR|nr:hypothetical protein B0H16DRAFT_1786890 [Mycena metata]
MVKNGLLACIFLMLQELFPPSCSFVFLLVVPHPMGSDGQERPAGSHLPHMQWLFCTQSLLNVSTSLFRISSDGQERPTGSHLPHGARNGGGRREQGPFPAFTTCSETDGCHVDLDGNPGPRDQVAPALKKVQSIGFEPKTSGNQLNCNKERLYQ